MAKSDQDLAVDRPLDRGLHFVETLTYGLCGLVLLAGAMIVLGQVAYSLALDIREGGVRESVTNALDGLLLAFILLELLAGVRATIVERKLVAEPFLMVGIIASIKEIVVVALEAKVGEDGQKFDDSMAKIGVLGVLILLLAVSSFLVRRKEREPSEDAR